MARCVNNMRKIIASVFLIALVLVFSCDTHDTSFEESISSLFALNTNITPDVGGTTVPSAGEFSEGEEIQIEAIPSEGFVFDRWEGDLTGNSNPETLTFDSNKSVTAHFSLKDYLLTIEVEGNGTVTETVLENPENNGNENTTSKKIKVEANSNEGWFFDRWEGDLSGSSNPDTIIVDEAKTVTAIFKEEITEDEFLLSVDTDGDGRVEKDPDKSTYSEGERVELSAVAENGWVFDQWRGDLSVSENPVTVTIDGDKSVTAVFEQVQVSEYTITINTEGKGRVDKQPDKASYLESEEVVLTAVAESGWNFKQWQGDLSGTENPQSVIVNENKSVTGVFEKELITEIFIDEVKLFVDEMKLSGFSSTKDFKTRNFILNLPIDGEPFRITHTEIPAGFYDELELEMNEPDDNIDISDPDFWNENGYYSLVVKGNFQGDSFMFRTDEDFEVETDLNPPLRISEGENSVKSIFSDFENWFKDSDDNLLNPSDPGNMNSIIKNIEDSFSDL